MVTIKDVAKKSGFSVATVSAVINGLPVVSPRAKEQILAAIQELGYRPNHVARSLKNAKTSSLAMIVRDITNPFYPEVVKGFEDVAWSNNYDVFLCNTENDPDRQKKYIDNLIGRRVDGVVITTSLIKREKHYDRLLEHGIPYVYLNRRPEQLLDHEFFIGSDNFKASVLAVRHLAELGYRDILYISGPLNLYTFLRRFEGFVSAMNELNLPIPEGGVLFSGEFMETQGYELAQRILARPQLPEAIFCSNDLLAFGIFSAFKNAGIRIPEDVGLIGLDNNRYSQLLELSTVEPQHELMGRTAGDILLALLNKSAAGSDIPREIMLEPQLVVRKSCGAEIRKK